MTRYLAVIDFDGSMYGASFPDVPGCVAMAGTQDEVINDASDALSEWIGDELAEGRAVAAPRDAVQIVVSGEVGELLSRGAFFASIPVIRDSGKLARANISLDDGLLAQIDETAKRLGVTRSAFLAAAARDKIKQVA